MEQNNEMTAQESLNLISETLNASRRSILKDSARYFILWGLLLVAFSLVIYELWHISGKPVWNCLWFAMPIVGYPLAMLLGKKSTPIPQNLISRQLGWIWLAYGVFVFSVCLLSVVAVPMPASLTLLIVLVLGFTESISGILLKNWPTIVAGFVLGVGGTLVAAVTKSEAQLLLFTLGGLLMVITGIIVKRQYK
ncbi:MAG: hypothetical protein IJK84_02350 [Bacteroidales bacterium]|nr:hypothetical protein [Bacteroidales bacterium]